MSTLAREFEADANGCGVSEDFVHSREHKAAGEKSIDFDGLLSPPLILHEDVTNGNGGQAWIAGMILTKYLLRMRRKELQHASIVELGAGGGLTGLAIAIGSEPKYPVHTTDMQSMLELMERNITLNSLQDQVIASVYNWGESRPCKIPPSPDIVIAAECVYFEPAFPLLQQTLRDLIGTNTVCYFCFKRRRRADMHFLKAVRKMFLVEDITDDPDHERYARENIFLCTIKRKAPLR
ncbi:hypothetical protein DOTSEDRAFT_172697 [Dothistroma septosporum NZE10]|uniref:Protein-lysine N-methyltransferase EFM6 n=1 Tax=Dothistroma septosporum (strain NZE10 / CBS 128990) TaxID=675120 RepID=N1PM93_DOTSN|nr:hypothetical protein DOTSEDRAFT_172697 [Dothistroma septosporum NZE10]